MNQQQAIQDPKTKKRFSFKKITFWVSIINLVFYGLALLILFYVKIPNQNLNLREFSIPLFSLKTLISIIVQIIFYYFSLNIYYRIFSEKKGWKYYLPWTLLLLLCCVVFYAVYDMLSKKEEFKIPLDISTRIFYYSLGCLFQLAIALIVVAIVNQWDQKKHHQQNQLILEQQKAQLEKEKLEANYQFLKAQINPHFLHNTLNFLYARALPYSAELSEGILTLSEIMRYSLNKEEDEDGKVLLTSEIEHLHNIIKIQQLRFGHALQLVFSTTGNVEGLRVLPLILITIVENAFKHGDLKDPAQPVTIELAITGGNMLHFKCTNKKKTGPKELSTGIGLDNTRKRLDLAYGDQYFLYIKDQRDLYTVDLAITL
jgi:sensor histidine kinase YesM